MPLGFAGTRALGLDVGAVSVSAVELDANGAVLRAFYELHHGEIKVALGRILHRLDLPAIGFVRATTSTPALVRADARYDNQICLITGARRFHPRARSILVVGGERFGVIRFDEAGEYSS